MNLILNVLNIVVIYHSRVQQKKIGGIEWEYTQIYILFDTQFVIGF